MRLLKWIFSFAGDAVAPLRCVGNCQRAPKRPIYTTCGAGGAAREEHSMPFDSSSRKDSDWLYYDCFTIDPTRGSEAWDKLTSNQMGLEIGMLPKALHEALLETLRERKSFKKALRGR